MGLEVGIISALAGFVGTGAATAIVIVGELAVAYGLSKLSGKLAGKKGGETSLGDSATRTANLREAIAPHEVVYGRATKGGVIFYMNGSGENNKILHQCLALAAHKIDAIEAIKLNGEEVHLIVSNSTEYPYFGNVNPDFQMMIPASGALNKKAAFTWRLGAPNQPAIGGMIMECSNWTQNHQARGIAYIYARYEYDETGEAFPNFVPTLTATMRGKNDIFDPRTGVFGWTDNPALIAADILFSYLGIPRERIDLAQLIDAANTCDEILSLPDGMTEKRYTCAGFFAIDGDVESWLAPVARAMNGAIVEHHGVYYIHAGKWIAPRLTITDNDLMDSVRLGTAASDRERYNCAKGIFAGAESFDQPAEFPQIEFDWAVDLDGFESWMDIDLSFVPSQTQAQRIAKSMLLSNRYDRTLELGVGLAIGLDLKPRDCVHVELSTLGISGFFTVQEHAVSVSDSALRPRLVLRETNPEIFDFGAQEYRPFLSNGYSKKFKVNEVNYSISRLPKPYVNNVNARVEVAFAPPANAISTVVSVRYCHGVEALYASNHTCETIAKETNGNALVIDLTHSHAEDDSRQMVLSKVQEIQVFSKLSNGTTSARIDIFPPQ